MSSFMKPKNEAMDHKVAKAELNIAAYFSEHNISYLASDHFASMCKTAFPDSNICKNISVKRTKLSYLVQDGIAYYEKVELVQTLRSQKFSLVIDESTDISVTQVLAIVVRYFDAQKQDVCDVFFDSVTVEDGSAQGLYKSLCALFESHKIPLQNIIGLASDNCNTMLGRVGGFQALLKKDVPYCFIMGCICHSFALCSSYAVKHLPYWLDNLLKDLSTYFARSSKRQQEFKLIQEAAVVPQHNIPKLCQTRWLSRGKLIATVLEQWDALVLFYKVESQSPKNENAKKPTLVYMHRKQSTCLSFFLNYILSKENTLRTGNFKLRVSVFTAFTKACPLPIVTYSTALCKRMLCPKLS